MKRFLAAVVLVTALAAACGSGGGEEQPAGGMGGGIGGGGDAQEGQAPPEAESVRVDSDGDTVVDLADATAVPTPTAESVPSAAADLSEQLEELVLSEDDVPADFSSLGSMDMDFDFDFLDMPTPQGMGAHMSIFAASEGEDMIVSMVILMEDDTALDEAFSQIDDLSIEEMQEAFDMVGAYADVALLDTRELDVSSLGDRAYGLGLTMEMLQMGTMDAEMVFFGEGPLLAMAMTMAMGGGAAVDVVSLAEKMADKIEDVVQ
ncbi:MAG: hypothetical protein JSU97_02345 [Dehalococcoidia bacterium]|nr:MAG: hypothetical protein JSU97_02345 [Dehalococcoidia bacterium]